MTILVRTVGEAVLARLLFKGADGQPMDATGVEIKALSPSGATVAGTPEPDGATGRWRARFTASEAGTWRVFGECAGPERAVTPPRFFRAIARPF